MIGDDLHGFFLTHEKTQALVLAVAEDAGFADAAFFPGFVARALVEEGFAVEE